MEQIAARDTGVNVRRRWTYWPEIDGLRTIAVLAVFVFHLQRPLLPGGFVGVDIFFVISGFLIGSILIDDVVKREFSVARFYQRRIARIFPALILVICATLLAGALLYSAQDMASLGINAAAAALSLINVKLITQGSYFILSPDSQPLLHYWSLAVEEQFYVVFPIYLYGVMRLGRWSLAVTLALAAVSFALCVALTPGHQPVAFYSLPTRAWELLTGAALALYRFHGGKLGARAATVSAWAGVAVLAGSIVLIDENGGFPGWIAAFPVLGAALLIAPVGDADPAPLRVLRQPWMVAIGKRSYSLYLWHWPVFSFVDYSLFQSSDAIRLTVKLVLAIGLTALSYALVERPARLWLNAPRRRRALFAATATIVAVIALGGSRLRSALYFDVPPSSVASGGTIVRGGNKATIILSGDSQAAMYGTEIASVARARGATLYALGTAGHLQLPGQPDTTWPAVAHLIVDKRPDLVILIDAWSDNLAGNPVALRRALAEIGGNARHVLLVTQIPSAPDTSFHDSFRAGKRGPFVEPEVDRRKHVTNNAIVHSLVGPAVSVLDVTPFLVGRDGALRIVGPSGRLIYSDLHHLSDEGTKILHPALARAIDDALAGR